MIDLLKESHPRYILSVNKKDGTRYNPTHAVVNGTQAVVIDVEVDQSAWIAYRDDEWLESFHWNRLRTSNVVDVQVSKNGDITIETENSFYHLQKIKG